MRLRSTLLTAAAAATVILTASPALAAFIPTDPTTSGQSANSRLLVDDHSTVSRDGFTVRWTAKLTCPAGSTYSGYAIIEERDPVAIPEIAGEDFGIRAQTPVSGTCTGHQTTLRLTLPVGDTTFFDPALGTTRTVHEPIHPTPANRANHAIQITGSDFFTQYCAAPACASTTGPALPIR